MSEKLRKMDYLKPRDVARLLRVEPGTVRLWTQSGKLRATTTAGGHRRFTYRDVELFAKEHGITLPISTGDEFKVLVVDDDKRVARLIKNTLLSGDPEILIEIAHDGFTAGQMVEKFNPQVVILDLIMPGIDGYQLCKRLKESPTTAGIRIIAITGDQDPSSASRIVKLGAETCLFKPLRKKDILGIVGL